MSEDGFICPRMRDGGHVYLWSTKSCAACGVTLEQAGVHGFAIFAEADAPSADEWVTFSGFKGARSFRLVTDWRLLTKPGVPYLTPSDLLALGINVAAHYDVEVELERALGLLTYRSGSDIQAVAKIAVRLLLEKVAR